MAGEVRGRFQDLPPEQLKVLGVLKVVDVLRSTGQYCTTVHARRVDRG